MSKKFRIVTLNEKFYSKYKSNEYPELLQKKTRPYNCLLTKSEKGYYICIPFRSRIKHKDAFLFYDKSKKDYSPGLDYTKTTIFNDLSYINTKKGNVKREHYLETYYNIIVICEQVSEYIDTYKTYIINKKENTRGFERRYKYSTLKYFHKELGIE
ncbi:MAG: hypothetical protein J6W35_04490 [Eubacterium sp.]|nr:hypothetical protein [Eubacterium sp.]